MNSLKSFKFHKFNDIPTNNSLEISKYLLNLDDNKRKKSTKESNKLNLSNKQLLKIIPVNDLLENEKENENEVIFENKNYSPYFIQEIKNVDFEQLFKNGQISKINNFLPQMAYLDLDNSKEIEIKPEVKLLLSKYQQILRYLFNLEKKMKELNNKLEKSTDLIINPKKQDKANKIDNRIEENENKIFILENKINIYKELILFNKPPNKSIYNFVLDIHDENYNYYCDICPNIKFNSYKEVQIHYLNEHKHILKIREANNNKKIIKFQKNNNNYEKFYFDASLNLIKDELKYLLLEANQKKEQDFNYNSQEERNINLKTIQMNDSKTLNNESFGNNINMDQNDLEEIEDKFNNFEKMNEQLLNNFDSFKKDIIKNLQNLQNNKPIVFSSNSFNYINDNKNISKSNENNIVLGEKYEDNFNEEYDFKSNNKNKDNYIKNNIKKIDNTNENIVIKNFYKTFKERENKLLFNKNFKYKDLGENYNMLVHNEKKNKISKKVDEMIDKKTKSKGINDEDIDKEKLKDIINDIYNENHLNKNFKNLLSIFDLKDLKKYI